jgi:hypothetical protein
MKIHKWLSNPMSAIVGAAIVVVDEEEIADVDKMFCLVDGGGTGHFGYKVELLTVGNPPKLERRRGNLYGVQQFGLPPYDVAFKQKRYYDVHVSRD